MIHHLVGAAKYMPVEEGLALSRQYQLGYEIPDFVEPAMLDNQAEHYGDWEQKLEGIPGMRTLHGPVYDINPVSLDPQIAAASRLRYQQAANVCKRLNCRYLVVHSQFSSIFKVAQIKAEWLSASVDYWQQFAEDVLSDTPTLSVVIENFMEEEPELLRELIETIDHPQIKACLDTGHANIYSNVSVNQWLDQLEHQLVYVHSHNNHGEFDEHRGYRYGTVNMEEFMNHLVLSPHKITLALEIFNKAEFEESYEMVQRYLTRQQHHRPEQSFLI